MDSRGGIDDDGDAEPLSVLDLPQIYQRPSSETLLSVLDYLALAPPSWDVDIKVSSKRSISEEGVPAYLTKIVSSPLSWIENDDIKEKIWEAASQRLSERSGRTGRGDLTRTFSIPLGTTDDDALTITLNEPALQADNLGLKTWASSFLLAKRLRTLRGGMPKLHSDARILELGAGTGLVGLAAAAVFKTRVVLTDLPEIVPNLQRNAAANLDVVAAYGGDIEASILDWSKPEEFALDSKPRSFPLILAADPIYSPDHPRLLVQAIDQHLSRSKSARAVIELPLREAYVHERRDLRARMHGIGLKVLAEGDEVGYDDWTQGTDRAEVRCWWSVWDWEKSIDGLNND